MSMREYTSPMLVTTGSKTVASVSLTMLKFLSFSLSSPYVHYERKRGREREKHNMLNRNLVCFAFFRSGYVAMEVHKRIAFDLDEMDRVRVVVDVD